MARSELPSNETASSACVSVALPNSQCCEQPRPLTRDILRTPQAWHQSHAQKQGGKTNPLGALGKQHIPNPGHCHKQGFNEVKAKGRAMGTPSLVN